MAEFGDHDGKSKTASGVDEKHYPEKNETPAHGSDDEKKDSQSEGDTQNQLHDLHEKSGSVQR